MAIIHEGGPGGKGGRSTRALSITSLLDIKGFSTIDLGSKEGYNSFDIHECTNAPVLGIEIRDSFLEEANQEREKLGFQTVTFQKADVREIDELDLGHFDLCLCSGLLYHMQNPFNLLKRIRNICRYVALETHVAPSFINFPFTGKKYRENLQWRQRTVILDGVPFEGRLNIFPASRDMKATSGSVASHATFWLSYPALVRAFDLAGFDLEFSYFAENTEGKPKILIDHGIKRTKVFMIAKVREPETHISAGASRIEQAPELLAS
ncbi:MAG: methyltransferase domain-containing protein [Chthoniobacterales bacterium]